MLKRLAVLGAMAATLAAQAVASPIASAARGLETGFADNLYASLDPSVRSLWLDRTVKADAGIARINVSWRGVAGSTPPVMPANPADPSYDFSRIDAAVSDAAARGLDVMLTVYEAPNWAEGQNRPANAAPGSWKPNPQAFRDFAHALASRYSGVFLSLPRVRYFEAWNEPNLGSTSDLTGYLDPQWTKGKSPKSPDIYRRLLNAFYDGVKSAVPADKVIAGALGPFGDHPGKERMRPLTFLRNLFCLDNRLKPTKCPSKPHFDILSQHPISQFTSTGSPHAHAANRNDVAIADFHDVKRVLRAAQRTHHVRPGGHHALWATEFWWITKPYPASFAIPVRKQARWIQEAFYLLWKQGARVAINLQIRDDPLPGFTSGIYFSDGKPKPATRSFRFPFVTHRRSGRKVGAWGKAPKPGSLKIQKRKGGGWRTLKTFKVRQGQVFSQGLRLHGAATLRGTVGGVASMPWHQGR